MRGNFKSMAASLFSMPEKFYYIVACLLFLAACTPPATEQRTITIGFIGPLTGDAAVFGIAEKNVIEMAVDEINAAGGINGTLLRVINEDGKCAEKEAVTAAHKLIDLDNVPVILAFCSAETMPIIPLTEPKNIIVFTSSTNPSVSEMGESVFRNSYSDTDTARTAAETIYKNSSSVGVIYELTTYPVGLKDAFTKEFIALGGTVYAEGFPQNDHDVRTQLTKLLAKNPTAIFVDPDTPATGIAVLEQLSDLQFNGNVYGNYFGTSSDVISKPEAEGLIFFADPELQNDSKKSEVFEKYKQRYGTVPQFEYYAATMYDSVYILKKALEHAGENTSNIRDYLYGMDDFTGLLGTYHFDKNGDAAGIRPAVKQIKNKQLITYG